MKLTSLILVEWYVNKPYLLLFIPLSVKAQNSVIEAVAQATPDPQVKTSLQVARMWEPDDPSDGTAQQYPGPI